MNRLLRRTFDHLGPMCEAGCPASQEAHHLLTDEQIMRMLPASTNKTLCGISMELSAQYTLCLRQTSVRKDENSDRFLREPVFVSQKAVHDLVKDGRTQPINLLRQEVQDRSAYCPTPDGLFVLARFDLSRR